MKISTFNKIERWYWRIWRVVSLALSIVFICILTAQIFGKYPFIKEVVKLTEPKLCSFDNLYYGQEVKKDGEIWKVTQLSKYEHFWSFEIEKDK